MPLSMAAMMAASAVPFFFAYGRDSRKPVATAAVVLIYVAVWALIGFAVDSVMGTMMMPSSLLIASAAVGVAVGYALTPWGTWARDRCREMARRKPRGPRFRDAVADGASYTVCCIACSAGIMLALVVVGMSNPLVVGTGATVMLLHKITRWPVPAVSRNRRNRWGNPGRPDFLASYAGNRWPDYFRVAATDELGGVLDHEIGDPNCVDLPSASRASSGLGIE